MIDKIKKDIQESLYVQNNLLSTEICTKIYQSALNVVQCFENSGSIYICGNGGSAAEAIHFSAEFLGRFKAERKSFPVFSLNADPAVITSIANDYGYEHIFSRQIKGILQKRDILIILSTSGNSSNTLLALKEAHNIGCKSICFLGSTNGKLQNISDIFINIPSQHVPRIQECQLLLLHILCDLVEQLFMQKQ